MRHLLLLLTTALLLCSCANKSMTRYEALAPTLKEEGFEGAIQKVQNEEDELYGENSQFLYYLDLGTLHHYNRNFKESARHLDKAEEIYEDLYTRSISNEAAAIVTNDNIRPYRARPFEIIILHEFQILNYLAMHDIDGALVEVRRAQIALEKLYQKDKDKVNDNGFLRYLCALVYDMAGERDDAAIAYIQAAKAFNEGNIRMPQEAWEFVSESLIRAERSGELSHLGQAPLSETPTATKARELGQEIVVIGYAGHSPILGEMYMSGTFVSGGVMHLNYKDAQTGDINSFTMVAPPVSGGNGETFHVGFSLPEKRTLPQRVSGFLVSVNGHDQIPEKFMDVNAELNKNIEDETPTTITRTAVRVILRTIAAQKAKEALQTENVLLNLLTNIGTDVAQSQLEQADLRIALFLPNYIYMSRIPVESGTHKVSVKTINVNGMIDGEYSFKDVKVGRGQKVFLLVPAIQ